MYSYLDLLSYYFYGCVQYIRNDGFNVMLTESHCGWNLIMKATVFIVETIIHVIFVVIKAVVLNMTDQIMITLILSIFSLGQCVLSYLPN